MLLRGLLTASCDGAWSLVAPDGWGDPRWYAVTYTICEEWCVWRVLSLYWLVSGERSFNNTVDVRIQPQVPKD